MYDPKRHTSPDGIWSYYFEPLESVALYVATAKGGVPGLRAPDDVDGARRACGGIACDAARNCRDATVVVKKLDWRHRVHRKSRWAVRAWYYGPKKKRTLPEDLAKYDERW